MRIVDIDIWSAALTLEEPYRVAYERFTHAHNVFVRLRASSGHAGLGCVSPEAHVTGETIESVLHAVSSLAAPLVKGKEINSAGPEGLVSILQELERELYLCPAARACVDIALHDLAAKEAGVPLWKLLGEQRSSVKSKGSSVKMQRRSMETAITIGILPAGDTVEAVLKRKAEGFSFIKLKGGLSVEEDVERITRVREAVGSESKLAFDANEGYTPEETRKFFRETAALSLLFLEQPVKELSDLVSFRSEWSSPVMADEAVCSMGDLEAASENIDAVNIKLAKAGGIAPATKLAERAAASSISVMLGCMDEAALGVAAALHLALALNVVRWLDLDSHIGLENDPSAQSLTLRNGVLFPADAPGLGIADL